MKISKWPILPKFLVHRTPAVPEPNRSIAHYNSHLIYYMLAPERLKQLLEEELEAFTTDTRHVYLDVAKQLSVLPKVDEAAVIVQNGLVPKYTSAWSDLLQKQPVVVMAACGKNIQKLVAAVELLKQSTPLTQFNQISTQPSLVNPAYKPEKSTKNVQVFFGDDIVSSSQDAAGAARREIQGHKVYDVPCLTVALATSEVKIPVGGLNGWSMQK